MYNHGSKNGKADMNVFTFGTFQILLDLEIKGFI